MRRAIARGRIVPQSRSTDPRMGRVSLKAATLFDRMWINSDDQGRLSGDPDEIKYTACPNLHEISKDDIPGLLKELEAQGLLTAYSTSRHAAIQMLDWWQEQKLQWAYPSLYPPPPDWTDHLRYHPTPTKIITENWPPSVLPSKLPSPPPSESASEPPSESASEPASTLGSEQDASPLTTPTDKEKEKEKEEEEGKGRLPSAPGSKSSPSSAVSLTLYTSFQKAWGRKPNTREVAQLRDLEKNISSAGATPEQIHDAFKEAAVHNKLHISYVRAVLLDWLGIERRK